MRVYTFGLFIPVHLSQILSLGYCQLPEGGGWKGEKTQISILVFSLSFRFLLKKQKQQPHACAFCLVDVFQGVYVWALRVGDFGRTGKGKEGGLVSE